ncbi:MAG: hypothetical protein DMG21_00425, partial [Acidobacteria bacterium]
MEDTAGAPIPGAQVRLENLASHTMLTGESDEDGNFQFNGLPLGQYVVTVTMSGFEEFQDRVEIGNTPPPSLRVPLKIAEVKQQVTVKGQASSIISAQENKSSLQLDERWLHSLPVEGGDPLAIPALFLNPAAAGAQGPQVVVDGVESNSFELPASAVREVDVNQNPYSAAFSRPGTGRLEVTTRQGSHHVYRGLVSLLMRNSDFDARNAFATQGRPPLQRAIPEGQITGPLSKHLTFFIAGRYYLNNQASVITANLPSGLDVGNFMGQERGIHLFGRLDYKMNHRNNLSVFYRYKDKSQQNQGVGGFNLPDRATDIFDHENEFRISETATVSDSLLNELRLTFKDERLAPGSRLNQPAIIVNGAFNSGGAQTSEGLRERTASFQDLASFAKGKHILRFGAGVRPRFYNAFDASNFGGTFTFSSLADYVVQRPFLFDIVQGNPSVFFRQVEFFEFLQDEVRWRPNLSLVVGLRHEFQSNVNYYGNFAPRLALAYAPGSGRTVMRLGGGVFYDRQPPLMEQQNLLYNGRLQEITIPDPAYPNPFSQSAALMLPPPSVFEIARGIRTPYVTQEGASIERQLGKGRNYLTVEFTHLRGVKLYRLRNINAPLPGTTVHPFPNFTNINQYESSGASQSDSLAITYQATVHRRFDLLAQYTLSKSMDDTPGLLPSSTAALLALATQAYALFPATPYDLRGEWGPSDYDRRHRFNLAGIYRLPHGFKTAAIVKLASSMPYNITTGSDDNHDDIP